MPQLKIKCPHCSKTLQVTVSGQQQIAQLQCPQCSKTVKFRVPAATQQQPPAAAPLESLDWLSLPESEFPSSNQPAHFGQSSSYQPTSKPYATRRGRQSGKGSKLAMWIGGGVAAALLLVCGVVGGIWLFSSVMPSGMMVAEADTLESQLNDIPRSPLSYEQVKSEFNALLDKATQSVSGVSDAELQTVGVERLAPFKSQFQRYFYLAAQARPKSMTMQDVVNERAKVNAGAGGMQAPGNNYIWQIRGETDAWSAATSALIAARRPADAAVESRIKYPDPLKETSGAFDWSAEDRRVLSAYWLQGELGRDMATEIMAGLHARSASKLRARCFSVIDEYATKARELAMVKSSQGTLLIQEPKGTPYARHAMVTREVLEELALRHPEQQISFVIAQALALHEGIESLQFGTAEGVVVFWEQSTQERYDALLAEATKAEEAEKTKLAADERARQRAKEEEESKLRAHEAAEQERQRKLAENKSSEQGVAPESSAGPGATADRPSLPGMFADGRRPGGMNAGGPPFGRLGGNGPNTDSTLPNNSDPMFRPQTPNAGAGNPSQVGGGSPPAGSVVTIKVSNASMEGFQEVNEIAKTITGNYQGSFNGGLIEIKVSQYQGTCASLVDKFPMLKFDSIDENQKVMEAHLE